MKSTKLIVLLQVCIVKCGNQLTMKIERKLRFVCWPKISMLSIVQPAVYHGPFEKRMWSINRLTKYMCPQRFLLQFCSFCLTGVNRRFQTYYLLGPSTSSCLVILWQRWPITKVWKNVNIYCHKLFLFSQCWYLVVHAQLISMSRCVLMMSRLSILLYWSKTHRIYKKWT